MAVARLKRRSDGFEFVIISAYGLLNVAVRAFLCRELAEIVSKFLGLPLLFDGDFDVMLDAYNKLHEIGGRDLGLKAF